MSAGRFAIEVPHICGVSVTVAVRWIRYPGTQWDPPTAEEEWTHADRCEKCGIALDDDTIFEAGIQREITRHFQSSAPVGANDDGHEFDPF